MLEPLTEVLVAGQKKETSCLLRTEVGLATQCGSAVQIHSLQQPHCFPAVQHLLHIWCRMRSHQCSPPSVKVPESRRSFACWGGVLKRGWWLGQSLTRQWYSKLLVLFCEHSQKIMFGLFRHNLSALQSSFPMLVHSVLHFSVMTIFF